MPDAGRVITGSAKGLRLLAPGDGTRPLSDRLKQALFSALESETELVGGAFLDLFAGSGAAGIEALSRGAELAVFVEHDAGACRAIDNNLQRARLEGGRLVRMDVLRFLSGNAGSQGAPFDACLLDPPYNQPLVEPALALLGEAQRGWLKDGAVVVAKHFWRSPPAEQLGSLVAHRRKRHGETMLSFYHQPGR